MQFEVVMPRFLNLCLLVAAERVAELFYSRAHERRMGRRGGEVVREPAYGAMVALHAGTLVLAPVEAALRRRPSRLLQSLALVGLGAATALRISALRALGDSWSTRVTRFPDGERAVVTRGPYRHVRHPNYAAVILELACLPLVGGAWLTALAASAVNAAVLARRIPLEERELARDPRWRAHFSSLPRFVPRVGARLHS